MPRTLGQLVTDVRARLDEATAVFWPEPQLRGWILEGARDIARRSETLQKSTTIAVTAGTQQYSAPSDAIRIYRAEWQPTGQSSVYPLEYKDFAGMDAVWWSSQKITQGYPAYFTMWGFPPSLNLVLYPIPSSGGVINLYYYRLPADLATDGTADNSNVDVPEGWWDLIPKYCEYTALRKDGDPRWQEAKALYEEQIQELVDITARWSDQAGAMEFQTSVLPAWLYGGGEY